MQSTKGLVFCSTGVILCSSIYNWKQTCAHRMTRRKLGFVSFVAARNCMRQQVAGRSSQLRTEKYYSVLQNTNPLLLCTTKFYSVLHSPTPVLLCTTKYYSGTTNYYSSTTLYYKVLLQYYSVLRNTIPLPRSTTPVPLCTTTYYSSGSPKQKERSFFLLHHSHLIIGEGSLFSASLDAQTSNVRNPNPLSFVLLNV